MKKKLKIAVLDDMAVNRLGWAMAFEMHRHTVFKFEYLENLMECELGFDFIIVDRSLVSKSGEKFFIDSHIDELRERFKCPIVLDSIYEKVSGTPLEKFDYVNTDKGVKFPQSMEILKFFDLT